MCKPISETAMVSSNNYNSESKLPTSVEEVHYRLYRKEDEKECQALFVQGRMSLLLDYYKRAILKSHLSHCIYTLLLVAALYVPLWIVGLALAMWCLGWYAVVLRAFSLYIKCQFQKDMNDIEGSYLVSGGTYLVATMGGKVVGMVGGRRHLQQPSYFLVCRMNVDKNAQKRGIAGKLMTRLEHFAREEGFETMCLTCTTAQMAAQALYQKHHFVIHSKKPSPSGIRGVDVCVFRKKLLP